MTYFTAVAVVTGIRKENTCLLTSEEGSVNIRTSEGVRYNIFREIFVMFSLSFLYDAIFRSAVRFTRDLMGHYYPIIPSFKKCVP
jgi:hypothetical protein